MVLMHTLLGKLAKFTSLIQIPTNPFSSHIHWYERMWPLTSSGVVDNASIINANTYYTNAGVSMTHLINGMAGNIESHSELDGSPVAAKTAYLDTTHCGFNKVTFFNSTVMKFEFVLGLNGTVADELTLIKPAGSSSSSSSSLHGRAPSSVIVKKYSTIVKITSSIF
jgi:Iron/zinc purple acid phosphatase-like protein C